jgi:type I restriction enzyme, S subunit
MTGGLLSSRPKTGESGKSFPATRHVKLADCVELLSGFAFKSQQFTDDLEDVALVKGENVSQGRVLWDISKRWPLADWEKFEKFQLAVGDVVIAMDRPWVPAGLKWCFIRDHDPKALLVQRCCRLRANPSLMDQTFLRCVIGGPGFESYIKPITTGVNIPHISGRQILDYAFNLPDLPTQRKIAGILSAYDGLIENNLRRIKILEEMAQSLYREWFVHFRFPRYKSAKFVDSPLGEIPKGWNVKKLAEIAEVNAESIRATTAPEEIHYIDIASVSTGSINSIEAMSFESAPSRARRVVRHGDIIWSTVRPNRRSFSLIIDPAENLIASTGFAVLSARAVPWSYLYQATTTEDFTSYLVNHASGAAYPAVNSGIFENADVIVPPSDLLTRFNAMAEANQVFQHKLHRRNQTLRQTRDLLLPRLLSGEERSLQS